MINGERLERKEEEVSSYKKGSEAKFQRLKQKKANLKGEVRGGSCEGVVQGGSSEVEG